MDAESCIGGASPTLLPATAPIASPITKQPSGRPLGQPSAPTAQYMSHAYQAHSHSQVHSTAIHSHPPHPNPNPSTRYSTFDIARSQYAETSAAFWISQSPLQLKSHAYHAQSLSHTATSTQLHRSAQHHSQLHSTARSRASASPSLQPTAIDAMPTGEPSSVPTSTTTSVAPSLLSSRVYTDNNEIHAIMFVIPCFVISEIDWGYSGMGCAVC